MRSSLELRDAIEQRLVAVDARLRVEAALALDAKLLMPIPGVNVTVAIGLLAAIGEIRRFPAPAKLAAYFGRAPSTYQSGDTCHHGRIRKQGRRHARWLAHQMGVMIPFCARRIGGGPDQLGSRSDDHEDIAALGRLQKRPIGYFRMFYGDTTLFGAWHAMESGLAFYGADHILFGADFPFDPEGGPGFNHDTIAATQRMRASAEDKATIYEGSARRLLRLRS